MCRAEPPTEKRFRFRMTDGSVTVWFNVYALTKEVALVKAKEWFGEGWREVKE